MALDPATLIATAVLVSVVQSILLFFAWRQNPESRALAAFAASFMLGSIGISCFGTRDIAPEAISVGLANALVAAAYGLAYVSMRVFNGRAPLWPVALIGAATWVLGWQSLGTGNS